MSKSEHISPKATASRFKSARLRPKQLCVHALFVPRTVALTRARTANVHVHTQHVYGSGVGGLLLRRHMIEQGAVSKCACAVVRWFEPCAHLEEEVAAREQPPAEPPRHGSPPASMHEHSCSAPAPLTLGPIGLAPTSAAQSLQHASKASKYVPIVGHMHMPTKHAMRKPLCTMEMLLDKKVLTSQHPVRRGKRVDASCRCPTAATGSSMRMRSFVMLMYEALCHCKKCTVNACGNCTA